MENNESNDRTIEELNCELNAIINSSSDGLFVCSAAGTVIWINPASERMHHIQAEEARSSQFREQLLAMQLLELESRPIIARSR